MTLTLADWFLPHYNALEQHQDIVLSKFGKQKLPSPKTVILFASIWFSVGGGVHSPYITSCSKTNLRSPSRTHTYTWSHPTSLNLHTTPGHLGSLLTWPVTTIPWLIWSFWIPGWKILGLRNPRIRDPRIRYPRIKDPVHESKFCRIISIYKKLFAFKETWIRLGMFLEFKRVHRMFLGWLGWSLLGAANLTRWNTPRWNPLWMFLYVLMLWHNVLILRHNIYVMS